MRRPLLRAVITAAAALTAIAMAACGNAAPAPGPGPGSPASPSGQAGALPRSGPAGVRAVTLVGSDALRFAPMTVHVHTGVVNITLRDMGAYPHNIVIPGAGVTSPTVTGDPGGATARFTVTFRHAGRYPFHCQYHQSAGMTGVFLVS